MSLVTPALFVEYAIYFRHGHLAPEGREVGGLFRVYYVGHGHFAGAVSHAVRPGAGLPASIGP